MLYYEIESYHWKVKYSDELEIHIIISRTITKTYTHKEVQVKIIKEIALKVTQLTQKKVGRKEQSLDETNGKHVPR